MGLGFTSYVVDNDRKFEKALNRAASTADKLKIPLDLIGADFLKSRKAIFGLKSPGQYPDLSTKPFLAFWQNQNGFAAFYAGGYKEYKAVNFGFVYPILKRTGALELSVTKKGAPGNLYSNDGSTLTIGTDVEYAKYHQSDAPRSKIPLRKFLFIGPEAPRFAQGDDLKGFPERAMNILNAYVLKQTGLSIEQATGTKPVISVDENGISKIKASDIS